MGVCGAVEWQPMRGSCLKPVQQGDETSGRQEGPSRHVALAQMAFHAHCLIPAEITPSPDELTLPFM